MRAALACFSVLFTAACGYHDTPLASCPNADNPYPDGEYPGYGDDNYGRMACSTGTANPGWLAILGALLLVVRRRRAHGGT